MTGEHLKTAREACGWTQQEAALRLGVTQAYLSMVERGKRAVSPLIAEQAARVFPLPPTSLPLSDDLDEPSPPGYFKETLGALGYPGYAYLRDYLKANPAEFLLRALDSEELDARVVEALPWVPLAYPELDWEWLTANVKLRNRQNRLGFVMVLAQEAAARQGHDRVREELANKLPPLERARLAAEDTLCHKSITQVERRWLRANRPESAAVWNLLCDMQVENLKHVYV